MNSNNRQNQNDHNNIDTILSNTTKMLSNNTLLINYLKQDPHILVNNPNILDTFADQSEMLNLLCTIIRNQEQQIRNQEQQLKTQQKNISGHEFLLFQSQIVLTKYQEQLQKDSEIIDVLYNKNQILKETISESTSFEDTTSTKIPESTRSEGSLFQGKKK